jgi:NAD+ synthase (glutamine-hydrolysing)
MYSNQQGCDGDRLYYDGACLIALNGLVLARGSQFSLSDVEVITATIDLEAIEAHRTVSSRRMQAAQAEVYPQIELDAQLDGGHAIRVGEEETKGQEFKYHTPEEEIALGPACWMWDYLRRSKTQGFFLPLSGGIDSCATAVIVHSMCRLVAEAAGNGGKSACNTRYRTNNRQSSR